MQDEVSRQAFKRGQPREGFLRRVVYTCLFGHTELFNDFRHERDGIDFVCFTDDPELRSDFWEIRLLPRQLIDPARAAKKVKALPHIFLEQYDWSLYLDNTVRLKTSPKRIFDEYLASAKSPMVCFRHYERDCVYEEAKVVVRLRLDTAERVGEQMALYKHLKYPARNGLAKGAFLLRRHHHPALLRPMNIWWEQISLHSKRDQLSLLPACWFEGFEIEYMPIKFEMYELLDWPVLQDGRRLPRDFDEVGYLKLNPDLANIGMDLRKHFLLWGQSENRKYRRSDFRDLTMLQRRISHRIMRKRS